MMVDAVGLTYAGHLGGDEVGGFSEVLRCGG